MQEITLCMTIGGRPDLLRRTLRSLLSANGQFFSYVIVANDIGDAESSEMAGEIVPQAKILHHDVRKGHLKTVDEMYENVETPLIFHCEDDWYFDEVEFIPMSVEVLGKGEEISEVAVRQSGCYWRHRHDPDYDPVSEVNAGTSYKFNSFTLNPTLFRRELWSSIGPYSELGSERGVDEAISVTGRKLKYLVPGVCYHIGEGRRSVPREVTMMERLQNLKRRLAGKTERA